MEIIDQQVNILSPASREEAIRGLKLVEYAGRNCYKSQNKITEDSYDGFINSLMKRGHESPLEFTDVVVELITSRDVMAELTRHRLASFCIQSQRYVKDNRNGEIPFIRPAFWGMKPQLEEEWQQDCKQTEAAYRRMILLGAGAQDARKVLNNSVATSIVMKANLREWLHVLEMRDSPTAYPEMQILAAMLRHELRHLFPGLFC